MASVRDLKKDINSVMGDIIEAVYIVEMTAANKVSEKGDAIIDEVVTTFDELIGKVNQKNVEDKKQHFKSIRSELESRAQGLVDQINAL